MQQMEQESKPWLKLTVVFIYILLIGFLTVAGGDGDVAMNLENPNTVALLKVLQAVSVMLIFVIPSLMFALFWTKARIRYLGLTSKISITTLLLAGVGMLLAMPVINWLAEINQHMALPEVFNGLEVWMKHSEDKATELTEAFTKGTSVGVLLLNLFVIAFMAALSEELFFRGVLQKVIIDSTRNKHIGVWLGAVIFSAFHMQFYGFVPRMLMGAYLGYLFLWSGSLWPGILAHFINNGMAVFLAWLVNRGAINQEVDKVGVEQGEWIYVAASGVAVLASLYFIYFLEKRKTKKPELLATTIEI